MYRALFVIALLGLAAGLAPRTAASQTETAVALPSGVRAVWDLSKAHRETTPTRERVCLNGLWRWQPAGRGDEDVPGDRWGYFKVPGCWPGITDYMQKDSQTVFTHPAWKDVSLRSLTVAWYQREIAVPAGWSGRRLLLQADYVNSLAIVFVDGNRVGEIRFPAGELDVTSVCRPGAAHLLSIRVVSMPLKAVMVSNNDTNAAREVAATVARRGLCGDVFLAGVPMGERVTEVKIETSVRRGEITVAAGLEQLAPDRTYTLRARIREKERLVREFTSPALRSADLSAGRYTFSEKWRPAHLWDLHTPGHLHDVEVSLLDAGSKVLDASAPVRFGFREFWIAGRDFYLNGSRVFLCALPLDNAQVGAALATYDAARESMERLKSIGINFVYTHNYGCEPGTHLSFEEILRAADDVGVLVALSQPHFSQYDWQSPDSARTNGYAQHAAFYVRAAQNHPSVVAYATSHNATGYGEDMNPDLIDGLANPRSPGEMNGAKRALRAEAIIRRLDPSRIVYHHSSGDLGSMYTANFYANFAPIQELSDWFGHWATKGVKPVFLCEYGVPFSWDWGMYRGWYKGQREWGSAAVPWEFCLAEWNAQFLGDSAYRISPMEQKNLRWEAQQFRAGRVWHRWDYPYALGSNVFRERDPVFAAYLKDNWRAFRTWGVSAISPWEYSIYWTLRDGVDRRRRDLPVDWEHLQQPGFSPDYIGDRYERMDLAYERSDWTPTAAGQALMRNNGPLLAYIGGSAEQFTSKDHNFLAGQKVEKQLILVNNSRVAVTCDCSWSLGLPRPVAGRRKVALRTGEQARLPLRFELPPALAAGSYALRASVRFSSGETQSDAFSLHVLPRPAPPARLASVALFDPAGETAGLLQRLQVRFQPVSAESDLAGYDVLIVGKRALTQDRPGPNVDRVRDGLKVVVFEQNGDVLEKRFGFRVAEYGLRRVFPRVAGHPLLAGLAGEHLRDWRGEATLLPPRLSYTLRPRYGPTVKWCDIEVPRLWRCGSRGSVASVLIEKPARGDFLPLVDGGFSLQYSPLLQYREGGGTVLFCQMDVTGRTGADPAADRLVRNILGYVTSWKPSPQRRAAYIGGDEGRRYLTAAGFRLDPAGEGTLPADRVLIVAPGEGQKHAGRAAAIRDCLDSGGHLLALGLDERDANAFLPASIRTARQEHIAASFEPPGSRSPFAGVAPADVQNRDPRELPLVTGGASVLGDGILAQSGNGRTVFCQLTPWQFDEKQPMNVKRTFRRTACLVSRLLGNLGVSGDTPLLARFRTPVDSARDEKRWLEGLYLDTPEEWDDPYRFFRW